MPEKDRLYPKQRLDTAIERGLARPKDPPERQRVRMGDNPGKRQKEDFDIRATRAVGQLMATRKSSRGGRRS